MREEFSYEYDLFSHGMITTTISDGVYTVHVTTPCEKGCSDEIIDITDAQEKCGEGFLDNIMQQRDIEFNKNITIFMDWLTQEAKHETISRLRRVTKGMY